LPHPRRGQLPKRRAALLPAERTAAVVATGDGLAAIPPGCSTISARAPASRRSRRRRRAAATTTAEAGENLRQIASLAGLPSPTEQLADWLQQEENKEAERSWPSESCSGRHFGGAGRRTVDTRCASRSATSQNSKRQQSQQQLLQQQQATFQRRLDSRNSWKRIFKKEQDEEEEDPDIGVESFVSGDISRPCPESEAVQLALGILEEHLSDYRKLKQNKPGQCWCFCTACWPEGGKRPAGEQPVGQW
uniref:UPF0472 protein C16orf72 n=1 Tax=Macrostomum lignano TaxID=282301 RepID=A0A1I8FE53_9PLAT